MLLIPIISIGVGYSYAASNHPTATISNTTPLDSNIHSKVQANSPANINKEYFQPSTFGNGTSINVTREILVNDYKYTTVTDTVYIQTNESAFNTFNYTLPLDLYYKIDHLQLDINGSSTNHGLVQSEPYITNTSAIYSFVLAEQSTLLNGNFSITMGINDLVANTGTINATFPFTFSGINAMPLFDFPMTQFNLSVGLYSFDTGLELENTTGTFYPVPSDMGLTSNIVQDSTVGKTEIVYSPLSQLPDFNYSNIKNEYQNSGNREFIPAYESTGSLLANFTYPVTFNYFTSNAAVEYSDVKVTIQFDEWGYVNFNEVTTLINTGVTGQLIAGTANTVPVYVHTNKVSSITAEDQFSNLTKSTHQLWSGGQGYPVNLTLITISTRSTVQAGATYTYDLSYSVPAKNFVNETSGFFSPAYNVSIPAMSLFNWTNRKVDLTVIFPAMSSVSLPSTLWGRPVSSRNISNGFLGLGKVVLKMELDNFSYLDNNFETFRVTMPPVVGPFYQMFYNSYIFFMAGLLIIIIRIVTQKFSHIVEVPSQEETQIPFELMRDFVTAYEEKTALRSRLSDLEKKKKNLRKVEYDQRAQTLKNKQRANDKKLIGITSELAQVSAVYRESIKNLELAEAERDQILAQIADLDKKKRQSRIRPEIYNKLKNEQNNRLNKAITRIERVLNELRSLLREAR